MFWRLDWAATEARVPAAGEGSGKEREEEACGRGFTGKGRQRQGTDLV